MKPPGSIAFSPGRA